MDLRFSAKICVADSKKGKGYESRAPNLLSLGVSLNPLEPRLGPLRALIKGPMSSKT